MYVANFCSVANLKSIFIVVVSERLVEKVKMCEIRSDIYGASDHVPVVMEIESDIVTGN